MREPQGQLPRRAAHCFEPGSSKTWNHRVHAGTLHRDHLWAELSPAAEHFKERANARIAVAVGFVAWTFDAFDFFVLTLVIPSIAREFGPSRPDIAVATTLTLATRAVGAFIFGL